MQMYSAYMRYTRTVFWPKNAIGIAASIEDMSERIARAESIAPSTFFSNFLCRLYALTFCTDVNKFSRLFIAFFAEYKHGRNHAFYLYSTALITTL